MSNEIEELMGRINRAWLEGRPRELEGLLHPEIVMVLPGFRGRTRGAEELIASFEEFCTSATVHELDEIDLTADVVGDTATASFRFAMLYERDGCRYRATGRDLWMFGRERGEWRATWRTLLDTHEERAD